MTFAALRRHYALQIDGSREHWTLTLRPLDSQVADYVTSVALSGSESRIARITVVETGGDRSVMEITELSSGERAPSGKTTRSLPVPPAPPTTGNPDAPAR